MKLFQNRTGHFGEEDFFRISSCPYSARSPNSPESCLWPIKISQTVFEKGHPKNHSAKFFQNWKSPFTEGFLRISLCSFSASSDYSRPRKRAGRHEKWAGRKCIVKSLPNNKILDWSKFKAFADDKFNVVRIMISVSDRVENIVGKGEIAGCQHFLLFPNYFQKDIIEQNLVYAYHTIIT